MAVGLFMVLGTSLSLSRHPHWFVRSWDFPRLQVAGVLLICAVGYVLIEPVDVWGEWAFLVMLGIAGAWQATKIVPYTPLVRRQVVAADAPDPDSTLRIVISNVQQDNDHYDKWLRVVQEQDPDVILALEVDDSWNESIARLDDDYPYSVRRPQDNFYGMALLSRLPLVEPEVRQLVQDDVPSIRTRIQLASGSPIQFYGVHPRPPEPVRDQDATPRDAELVIVGREIDRSIRRPTITAGDFNDVGWSRTTKLFCDLSGLLDPRVGRGFYNTFDANSRFFRFPLDHIFHSNDFEMVDLSRLDHVGSDHFPVCVELYHTARGPIEQTEHGTDAGEEREADEKLERAAGSEETKLG